MAVNPFGWIAKGREAAVLAALSVLVLGLSLWLSALGQALETPAAPQGIVSFELAGGAERSAAILASWAPPAQATAMLIQGLDFLYLCVYPAWFSLAAARLGASLGGRWRRIAWVVSWAVLACVPLDAVENLALIRQLMHGASASDAALAWWCATPKFALVALAAAFLAAAAPARWLAGRRAPGSRSAP